MTSVPQESIDALPPASLLALPVEILVEVLELASPAGQRQKALLSYMTVCKALAGSAHLLLHQHLSLRTVEQAEGFLASLHRAQSPTRLASSARRLSIAFENDSPTSIPSSLAIPILFLLDNLHVLDISTAGDDELRTLRQALASGGGGMKSLRKLKTSKIRWDHLVELLQAAHKLEKLSITGLHGEAATAPPAQQGDAGGDNTTATLPPVPEATSTLDPAMQAILRSLTPMLVESQVPDLPDLPPVAPSPLFPSLPLTSLVLHSPDIPDELFLSILSATHNTLSCLSLIEASGFSRIALVIALKGVPNLLELHLDQCRFPPFDLTAATAHGIGTPQNALAPLPTLTNLAGGTTTDPPPPLLASPLPPNFHPSTARLTPPELAYPLDHLYHFTPFLHVLSISSDHLLSSDPVGRGGEALNKIMALLPLQFLTLDVVFPRLGVDEVVAGAAKAEGRLEAVAVGKRMRWTQGMLDQAKRSCADLSVLLSGEAEEEARIWEV